MSTSVLDRNFNLEQVKFVKEKKCQTATCGLKNCGKRILSIKIFIEKQSKKCTKSRSAVIKTRSSSTRVLLASFINPTVANPVSAQKGEEEDAA